jgi:hypothetical protein
MISTLNQKKGVSKCLFKRNKFQRLHREHRVEGDSQRRTNKIKIIPE